MPTHPNQHRPAGWRPPAERVVEYDRWRGSASDRGYDATWRKTRNAFMAANPICRICLDAGRVRVADMVDHIVPVKIAPDGLLDPDGLQSLCNACHQTKTRADEKRWPSLKRPAPGA